ncbi:MAG: hydrolase [Pseudonocardiales bacterium]|nr:hydrolase [Pseudonocardiales bacterium]
MERQEHTLTGRGGVNIAYDVWEPDVPSRGILVISHGLGEHGRRYDHVARRFAALGLTVVVPDHRGHGRSGGPRAGLKRFDDLTDDLQSVFDAVTADRTGQPLFLLGHSMGGAIALHYALDRPDALNGLILSAAAVVPGDEQPKAVLTIAKILGRFAPGLPTAKLDSAGISKDPAVVKAYNEDPLVFTGKVPAGLAGGLLGAMDTFPKRLPTLTVPLLVLHGEADVMTSPSGSTLVIEKAGSADKTLKTYPGLYHEIFNEPEQDVVLDDVATWLDTHL